ncbi:serine/arginine-rich splicing factor 5-like [Styela clava]
MAVHRVYVGRLSTRAREEDVERFFEGYGRIRDINLKNGYGFVEFEDERDAEDAVHDLDNKEICGERVRIEHARGNPRGGYDSRERSGGSGGGYSSRGGGGGGGYGGRNSYGYSGSQQKRVSYFQSRAFDKYGPPTRTEWRVIVENLSTRVSWQDLKDYLRQAGEVTYADAHKERRNEATVEFATYKEMKNCIDKLDDTEINGRRIKLREYKWRNSRSRSRSRRSRSRSPRSPPRRSRSRSPRRRTRSKSASRSRSRSRFSSRSRSRTPPRKDGSPARSRSPQRSRSRSRSASYEHANGGDD